MKTLKIVLVVFVALSLLLIAGGFVFLKTFDLNKYIPQITDEARKAMGRQVKIGRADLAFSFTHGIALNVKDVAIADDPRFSDKPFFTVDHVDVGLDVGVLLLAQKLQLTEVTINAPKITIMRLKDGLVNVATIASPTATSAHAMPKESKAAAVVPALLVKDVKVTGAQVSYIDEMAAPRMAVMVDQLDVAIHNFSLTDPFDVAVNAALFSAGQNVVLQAKVRLDILKETVRVSPLRLSFDLAKIDAARLARELPMTAPLNFKRAGGQFIVDVPDLVVGAKGVEGLKAQVTLDKGAFAAGILPAVLEDVVLKADVDGKQMDVKVLSLQIVGGVVNGNALVVNYLAMPVVSAVINVQGVDVKRLLESYNLPVRVSGALAGTVNMKFSGKTPEEAVGSLNGDFKGELTEGVLENVNLLALGLGNIPMLPGLLDSITGDLPAPVQEEVKKGITLIQTCSAQARLVNGVIQLDAADMVTRDILAHAQGVIDLKGSMEVKADIRMEQALSERLSASVKELSVLKDEQGRLYIPVGVSGPTLKPQVMPDVEYLTKKLITAKGAEALQGVLGTTEAAQAVDAIFGLFKKK